MKKQTKFLFIGIIIIAAILRLYKLDQIPPSLNWDEVAAGYNAFTIANWGRDEYGKAFPVIFTSFRDDKHPVHIYITAIIIKLLGFSDFTVRLSGALLGIFGVVIIFYLAKNYFKSESVALLSSLFLAISPQHMHFSRGLWEANFAPFFLMLGLLLFQLGIEKKNWLIPLSFFSFGLSLFSYHSAKIVVPPIILLLLIFNFKILLKNGKYFILGLVIISVFFATMFFDKRLLGLARVGQTRPSDEVIKSTKLYQVTKNDYMGLLNISLDRYSAYFSPDFLFIKGDQNPRGSIKVFGEFYKIDSLFIVVGFISLILLRKRVAMYLLLWVFLAPLPASVSSETPNATRAIFMVGSMQLISAYGAGKIISWFRGGFRKIVIIFLLLALSLESFIFIKYYFTIYPKNAGIDWVYGMKQIVDYIKENPDYSQIFMTEIRSQPYIFFLYYLKYPVPDFLRYSIYNSEKEGSSNTVANFDKYYFGGWDFVESMPYKGVLYIVTPYQYTGLKHKSDFKIKKTVNYPDGSVAFYLVSVE